MDLLLSAIRPMHRHPKSTPPKVSGDYILGLTTSNLEKTEKMMHLPSFQDFLWFGKQYTQWHTIAVMVAELCIHTRGPMVERAWAVLDRTLEFFKQIIADSEQGMLWRPIEKLLKRAREKRAGALGTQMSDIQQKAPEHYPTAFASAFPGLGNGPASQQTDQALHPQTANSALAFQTASPTNPTDVTMANPQTSDEDDGWKLPPDFVNIDIDFDGLNSFSTGASPENGWQNWGCFTDDVQAGDPMFPAQLDDVNQARPGHPAYMFFPWT